MWHLLLGAFPDSHPRESDFPIGDVPYAIGVIFFTTYLVYTHFYAFSLDYKVQALGIL